MIEPGILLAAIHAEGHDRAEGKSRVFTDIIIRRGVAHFDRGILHGIKRLQAGDDFARCKALDLELAVGGVRNGLGEGFRAAENRIQRFREA